MYRSGWNANVNYPAGVTAQNIDRLQGIVEGPGKCGNEWCDCDVPNPDDDLYCDDVCEAAGELRAALRRLRDIVATIGGDPRTKLLRYLDHADRHARDLAMYALEVEGRCDDSDRHYHEPMSRADYEEDER